MSAEHIERERKYDGGWPPRRFEGLPGVAQVVPAEPQMLDAVYYDTPDLRLLRRQITLRRRTGGNDAGWHLKLPRDADTREEIHEPLASGATGQVPSPLTLRLAVLVRGRTLVPVAHLHTRRRRELLLDAAGATLAEITEDQVTAQTLDPPSQDSSHDGAPAGARSGGPRTQVTAWTETEVELEEGDVALLDGVEDAITGAGGTRSRFSSKLARVLSDRRTPASGRVRLRQETPGAVVAGRIREQFGTLMTLDPRVRLNEPDSVHRMRVAARRLRSLLKAHRRLFDRGQADPLAAELRWLGRSLGRARDQEVLGEHLAAAVDGLPPEVRRGDLRARITGRYAHAYRQAWEHTAADLATARYYKLLDALEAFADDPPFAEQPDGDGNATELLSRTLRREQRRTVKRLDAALVLDPGPARDDALHRARKAAKRARYTAESARRVSPERAKKFAKRMKSLQRALGAHQDAVIARTALMKAGSSDGGRHAFAYGVMYGHQQEVTRETESLMPDLRRRAHKHGLANLT
ncbi:CHAD domain-containing protein [Kitasatospora sp. NPDC050543]|uniref:CYTH and CHAD domain-containing protein n=1 Tax=Kitasatospora sp. NPDC050543 TaxID=3364054 RepID=UPI00379C2301